MDGASTAHFQVSMLGRFELTGPTGPIDLTSKKLVALLAFLACTAPEPQGRDKVMTLLWGSHFDAQARQNLRQALTRLRRVLGNHAIISDAESVTLRPGIVATDVKRFETLLREGGDDGFPAAIGLYRGRFLADIAISEEAWTEWLDSQRRRLEDLAVDAMLRVSERDLQLGNHTRAHELANRAAAVNSLREDAHRLVMRSLAASGRRADAIKHYEDLVALFKRELAVDPDPSTRALALALRKPDAPNSIVAAKPSEAMGPIAVSDPSPGHPPLPDRPSIAVLPW